MMTLTLANNGDILQVHSQKTSVRFRTRKTQGAGDSTNFSESSFLCPKSFLISLKNLSLWWGGLLEQFLGTAFETSFLSHRPKFRTFSGGLQSNQGQTAMKNHTKKLTNHVSDESQSRFNVLTRSGRSIARKISFKTAISLKSGNPEYSIKFDSMEVQS